jgi:hypothetical protein
MTGKIAQPSDIHGLRAHPDTIRPQSPTSDKDTGAFEALVRKFRGPQTSAADFLGQDSSLSAGASSAKQFNADGFFGKLEAVYASKQASLTGDPIAPALTPGQMHVGQAESIGTVGEMRDRGLAAARLEQPDLAHRPSRSPTPGRPPATFSPSGRARTDHAPVRFSGELAKAGQVTGPERVRTWAASPSRAPFRIFVEGGSIHVTGPIHDLTSDEENRLVDEVTRLLIEHGLGPADLLANGRVLTLNNQKRF